jgi:hypothetical protein
LQMAELVADPRPKALLYCRIGRAPRPAVVLRRDVHVINRVASAFRRMAGAG